MTRAIYQSYLLALCRERYKPPHNHWEMATNNHQLVIIIFHCSKPSRWWQPPRVIRKPQLKQSPSATRCNHSCKYTWNHSQSHYDDESMKEISERCLIQTHKDVKYVKVPRDTLLGRPYRVFQIPQRNRAVGSLIVLNLGASNALMLL